MQFILTWLSIADNLLMYIHNCSSMLSTRVNIMFNKTTWLKLKAIAKKQETTTSELVRRAIHDQYISQVAEKRREAIDRILSIRPMPATDKIDYKELVDSGHKI